MRRREFVTLIGGAAATWPLVARAQQTEQMRRIGALMNRGVDDPEGQARLAAIKQGLAQSGWSDGRYVRIDVRWGEDDPERMRKYAAELVALSPDVIVAGGSLGVTSVQRVTSTLPIVFAGVGDPVGGGFVDTLARPGGNTTGFMLFEYSMSGKWLELLKQIAPSVTRWWSHRNTKRVGMGSSLSGRRDRAEECPLSGVKRTSKFKSATSAFDPKRTSRLVCKITPA